MCLYSRRRLSRKARHDIECWKAVTLNWTGPYHLFFKYRENNRCEDFEKIAPMRNRFPWSWWFSVCQGFHSFQTRKAAESAVGECSTIGGIPVRIVRAVIPKGSRYYKGMDDDYCSEYIHFPDLKKAVI